MPVRFCASMGLGEPPTADVIHRWLGVNPQLRFKLDATVEWDDALVAELAATGAVEVVDLKGHYAANWIDFPADEGLYRRVAEGLPDVLIEDPGSNQKPMQCWRRIVPESPGMRPSTAWTTSAGCRSHPR